MSKKKQEQETTEESAQERVQELQEQLARISADYANYRRRTQQQAEENKKKAAEDLIREILAVIDNLELALNNADEQDGLYQGVELVLGQLITVLESQGVQRIETTGEFDANRHEAILTAHSDKEEGMIIEVLQQGYELAGKPLRTAKVKVSKGPENNNE